MLHWNAKRGHFYANRHLRLEKKVENGEEDEEGKGGGKRERQAGRGVVYFIPLLKKGEDERREEFLLLCFVNQNVTLRRRGRPSICRKSLSLPFHPSIPSLPFPFLPSPPQRSALWMQANKSHQSCAQSRSSSSRVLSRQSLSNSVHSG